MKLNQKLGVTLKIKNRQFCGRWWPVYSNHAFYIINSMMADGQRFHFNEMAKASGRLLWIGGQRIYIYKLNMCIYGR